MKRLQVAIVFALMLACSATAKADVIFINWTSVDETVVNNGFMPSSASDWVYGTIVMFEGGTGFAPIHYETGNGIFAPTPMQVQWCCGLSSPESMNGEVGHATSVALVNANNYDTAIEVHQGGQDNGSLLWYSLGSGKLGGVLGQQIPAKLDWAPSQSYGNGFNPSVAGTAPSF